MPLDPLLHPPHLPRLLEVHEVAYQLRCSPETVLRLIRKGKLAAFQPFGRSYRVDVRDLEAYLTATRVQALEARIARAEGTLDAELGIKPRGRDGPREVLGGMAGPHDAIRPGSTRGASTPTRRCVRSAFDSVRGGG
jgi:excisionase family DNA binding protein